MERKGEQKANPEGSIRYLQTIDGMRGRVVGEGLELNDIEVKEGVLKPKMNHFVLSPNFLSSENRNGFPTSVGTTPVIPDLSVTGASWL